METLKKFINSQVSMDETDLEIIVSNFKEFKIGKERFALKQGQIATNYFFVKSGALRIYLDHNDQQITSWIALENEFFTDLSSQKNQLPSKFNIQAIEDTVLLIIQSDQMEQLYKQFPLWQQFVRRIWEANFRNLVEGVIGFQTLTAEERYRSILTESELLQRVPLKYLASFLGITQTSLSRLRKKMQSIH
jgi:CRP-like cAMP-binding protein